MANQLDEGLRPRRAVGIHVADQFSVAGQFESLNERAALADGGGKIQLSYRGKFLRDALDDGEGVVATAVENHDKLELARVVLPKKIRVFAQHRFDARFFVVSRDEEQQAWIGHTSVSSFTGQVSSFQFVLCGGRK